jgi:hypothetical protein
MDYVTYNETGALTGSYSQDLSPEHASCYIEVTPAQRQNWTGYRADAARAAVELIPAPAPDLPAPTVPASVPLLNLIFAVIDAGHKAAMDSYFSWLAGDDGSRARERLARSQVARRDCDLVSSAGVAAGLDAPALDQLFISAAALNP